MGTVQARGIAAERLSIPPNISAVDRTVRVLELLSFAPRGVSVTELGEQLGIGAAQAYRTLTTLELAGWVYKDSQSQQYGLTSKFLGLAFQRLEVMDTYDIILPVLRNLAQQTGEQVDLNWLESGRMVVVAKADSPRLVKVVSHLGTDVSFHASAAGKVYLAGLPEEDALRILAEHGLPRLTERTITQLSEILAQLRVIREQGYAINDREWDDDLVAVAAPVYGSRRRDQVTGAVAVSAPAFRAVHTDPRVIELTKQAADEISSIWPFKVI